MTFYVMNLFHRFVKQLFSTELCSCFLCNTIQELFIFHTVLISNHNFGFTCFVSCFCISGSRVIVKEDDDAILSCSLNNMNIKPMLFDWRKDTERLQVFMYNNGILHNKGPPNQDKQFSGRVSHFPEELEHGNASIIIRKTKVIDSGSYTCEFPHLQPEKIFHIELIVGECCHETSDYLPMEKSGLQPHL